MTNSERQAKMVESTIEVLIMLTKTEDIVAHIREWSIERSENESLSEEDSLAIITEFFEWIEPDEEDIQILSIEF